MSANIKPAASTALVLQDEGGTDVITISTAGNVGVGNGSPTQKLDVTGNINASGALTLGTALAVAEGGTGSTTESAARTALGLEIGSDVQAYDADTAKYDDTTANFTGTLQNGGSNVVVDSDIGSTVQAYDADTTKNDVSNTFSANQIISVSDNTNAALRITQTGTGNALVVEDNTSPDSTPVVIDQNGFVVAGSENSYAAGLTYPGRLSAVNNVASTGLGLQVIKYRTTASLGADIELAKSATTTFGNNVAVSNDHSIGSIWFNAADGTNFITAAKVSAEVDGTPGTNDMPGRLVFSTTPDGSSSPTERMRIDSSGNVGIGTTQNDFAKLELKTGTYGGSQAEDGVVLKLQTSEGGSAFSGGLTIQTSSGGAPTVSLVSTDDPTTRTFQPFIESSSTATNQYTKFLTAGTERMRIDSSGNVGVGTSAPGAKLDVNGTTQANNFLLQPTAGTVGYSDSSANVVFFDSTGAFGITNSSVFHNGGTERMRIDSSGNALIGYTSSNGSYKLQVNSQIFATSAIIATSDGRYKENVTSLDGALNLVAQLNPVQFTWKEHPVHEFDRTQPTVGFIAQEVQEVLKDTPYVNSIIKANECLVGEEKDEEGNIITEGTTEEFLGIAEGNLIALLTKALQEANAKIDALETRIQALEA